MSIESYPDQLEPENQDAVISLHPMTKFREASDISWWHQFREDTRPPTPPPDGVLNGHRRKVELRALVTEIVVTPWARPYRKCYPARMPLKSATLTG
jgi:hypothetical protein